MSKTTDEKKKLSCKGQLIEGFVVGIILTIITIAIHGIMMVVNKKFSMSHNGIALNAFISGALFHILADNSYLNYKYCSEYPKEY